MIIVLICIGVIVDLTACWSYCSYKNYKEISKNLQFKLPKEKSSWRKKSTERVAQTDGDPPTFQVVGKYNSAQFADYGLLP